MELSGIGKYLELYKEKLYSQEDKKRLIIHAIFTIAGVVVDEKDISIKHTVVSVHTDSVTRNQLFLYRKKIIEEIKLTTVNPITEIR